MRVSAFPGRLTRKQWFTHIEDSPHGQPMGVNVVRPKPPTAKRISRMQSPIYGWWCMVDGKEYSCHAYDKSEARSKITQQLGVERLPVGVVLIKEPA